ncbi:hypothetical protein [Jiella sonneratiae]|uniref:ParB/Sulfiredoxin domain-containing protein n=1 Tax=Jiella sonneratiae TaxID=2816856 RepID=A0ABS3IX69_9HYPH|nr:hypothetical protein [Jiella sonneratiae]MBO0902012.1 hypothetical protein [Jiella sonneratiae]
MLTSPDGVVRAAASAEDLADGLDTGNPQATQYVRTQDGYVKLPIVAVDAARLIYRADNGRILSEVRLACRAEGATDAEGRIVEGDRRVQSILHRLLLEKAMDENSPIFAELEQHALQTEPLLVTRRGLVVNGNRRLASMRELLARDPEKYAGFKTVACAVMPDSFSHETIEFIEANLQMAPDLKLGYSWINRRLKLREHAADLPRDLIVDAYRLKDAGEIDTELAELALAESYLAYLGAPGEFSRVVELEEYFLNFHAELQVLQVAHLRDLWTLAGFAMLATREALDRPVDHYYPFTAPKPHATSSWVLRSFAADRGVADPQSPGNNEPVSKEIAGRLRPILADPANAKDVARHVIALIDTLKSNETELLGAIRVLGQMRAFRKTLESKGPALVDERQHREIKAELVALLSLLHSDEGEPRAAPRPALSGIRARASERVRTVMKRLARRR